MHQFTVQVDRAELPVSRHLTNGIDIFDRWSLYAAPPTAVKEDDEDAELRQLQAELAM